MLGQHPKVYESGDSWMMDIKLIIGDFAAVVSWSKSN
jgi:hypothetical protein